MKKFICLFVALTFASVFFPQLVSAKDLVVTVPGKLVSSTVYADADGIIIAVGYECEGTEGVCYTYVQSDGGPIKNPGNGKDVVIDASMSGGRVWEGKLINSSFSTTTSGSISSYKIQVK